MTDPEPQLEELPSPRLAEIVRLHIEQDEGPEESERAYEIFQQRAGEDEFHIAAEYSRSCDPLDRLAGVHLLQNFGVCGDDAPFAERSLEIVLPRIDDENRAVAGTAAWALARLPAPLVVDHLLEFSRHADPEIRHGVAYGLGLMSDEKPAVIETLMRLAKDEDRDVRDWATFGIGSQSEQDSPEIRQLLMAALNDPEGEIRGEGFIGLANRADPRMTDEILRGLSRFRKDAKTLTDAWRAFDPLFKVIEAIAIFPDSRLEPLLSELHQEMSAAPATDDFRETVLRKVGEALGKCAVLNAAK